MTALVFLENPIKPIASASMIQKELQILNLEKEIHKTLHLPLKMTQKTPIFSEQTRTPQLTHSKYTKRTIKTIKIK
jgi:hypothetical protein